MNVKIIMFFEKKTIAKKEKLFNYYVVSTIRFFPS